MNSAELKRLLAKNGCKFETHRGGSGHQTVRRGNRKTVMPVHGGRQELGTKLVRKILRDLDIKV
jgi:mRNA interferase HicA